MNHQNLIWYQELADGLILAGIYANASAHAVAVITLNNPRALNAQNTKMIKAMAHLLDVWSADTRIKAVLLRGAGDKALCAGGDIKSLAQVTDPSVVAEFFVHEYALMQTMLGYAKPIIAWGDGIVMGGGLGLLAVSSHKMVTPRTIMAMPEVSIGLFPDAGGSWFLRRMAGKVGLFLGLTGARFTGVDALHLGLGDFYTKVGFEELLRAFVQTPWASDDEVNGASDHSIATRILNKLSTTTDGADSQIFQNFGAINAMMNAGSLIEVDHALKTYTGDSQFIQAAIDSYKAGSDTTKAVTWRIYHAVIGLSLDEIYRIESKAAIHSVLHGDFAEGVRALLIDKDKTPKWRYELATMPKGYVEAFFGGLL